MLPTLVAASVGLASQTLSGSDQRTAATTFADWLGSHGGRMSDRVALRPSAACGGGTGVFATAALTPGEELGSIPFAACMSYHDAYEDDGDVGAAVRSKLCADEAFGRASVGVAALLASTKWDEGPAAERARARWGTYVESLPWETARLVAADRAVAFERDAELRGLRAADLERRALEAPSLTESIAQWRRAHVARARGYAMGVQQLLAGSGLPLEACWAALWLVESRAFITAPFGGSSCVLVPFADLFNHPSASALAASGAAGAAFANAPSPSDASISWTADMDRRCVLVRAARGLAIGPGDEIWNWYSEAGYGAGKRDEWAKGEAAFVAQYNFSPWD